MGIKELRSPRGVETPMSREGGPSKESRGVVDKGVGVEVILGEGQSPEYYM